MKNNLILVPHDYTEVADNAVSHAVVIAKSVGGEIGVLHVVKDKNDLEEAKAKVQGIADAIKVDTGVDAHGIIRVGNIFDDIGDAAAENDAMMIVMGTHGMSGMQFLTGSYALRVITNSAVPFIIVQDKKNTDSYKHIVLPMDLAKETKQKLKYGMQLAKYFGSKLHVFTDNENDEYLKNQLHRNIAYAKKYLGEHKVSFSTTVNTGEDSFVKEIIKYSITVDADLICIMNLYDGAMDNMFGKGREQYLITNEAQIPVMCVNPKSTTITQKRAMFG